MRLDSLPPLLSVLTECMLIAIALSLSRNALTLGHRVPYIYINNNYFFFFPFASVITQLINLTFDGSVF